MMRVVSTKLLFVLVLSSLIASCATPTDNRSGALANYLYPPAYKYYDPKRGGPFTRERSMIFIEGLFRKWRLFQDEMDKKGVLAFQHDVDCAKRLEKTIKEFSWPIMFNKFKAERERIQTELIAQDCHPVA